MPNVITRMIVLGYFFDYFDDFYRKNIQLCVFFHLRRFVGAKRLPNASAVDGNKVWPQHKAVVFRFFTKE